MARALRIPQEQVCFHSSSTILIPHTPLQSQTQPSLGLTFSHTSVVPLLAEEGQLSEEEKAEKQPLNGEGEQEPEASDGEDGEGAV